MDIITYYKNNYTENHILFEWLINSILDNLDDLTQFKELHGYYITHTFEKHNELQYTHRFYIQSNLQENFNVCLTIENGIANGTKIVDYQFDVTPMFYNQS